MDSSPIREPVVYFLLSYGTWHLQNSLTLAYYTVLYNPLQLESKFLEGLVHILQFFSWWLLYSFIYLANIYGILNIVGPVLGTGALKVMINTQCLPSRRAQCSRGDE